MTARTARLLLALGAFVAGLALFSAVIFIVTGGASPIAMTSAVGGPFRLVDQNDKPITDPDLKGEPFLVFFGFTHCPDVCPTTLFDVSEIFRALGPQAKDVRALFVTVDPERDTPSVMKDSLRASIRELSVRRATMRRSRRRKKPIGSMPRRSRSMVAITPWIIRRLFI